MNPQSSPTPNVHTTATSGLDPEQSVGTADAPEIPDEGSGTRDGVIDDIRPLGLSEDPSLDDPDYYSDAFPEEDSDGTADGTVPDPDDQETEGTADGTAEGVEVAPSGDDSGQVDPGTGDGENAPENGADDSTAQ